MDAEGEESKACRHGIMRHWACGTYTYFCRNGDGATLFVVAAATKLGARADLVQ